jgi:hypothetical protein
MRAAEIKAELFKRGVSFQGLFEKSELVDKLSAALADESRGRSTGQKEEKDSRLSAQLKEVGGFQTPLERLKAREGTLGRCGCVSV